ncbi:MAG: hypothetical protein ABGY08_02285, partial [Gammaproteobacteria bacterium]
RCKRSEYEVLELKSVTHVPVLFCYLCPCSYTPRMPCPAGTRVVALFQRHAHTDFCPNALSQHPCRSTDEITQRLGKPKGE